MDFIEPENGELSLSYGNIEKLINLQGLPVGAIHMLAPNGESITNFFFFKGHVHTCLGFEVGRDEDKMNNVIAFTMALQLIPGWQINTDPAYVSSLENKSEENKYFIFRASGQTCSKYVNESPGMIALINSIMLIKNEDGEILEQE